MRVALYGAYAADVNLDSSALKDAGVDCSTTFDGNEFQSPTVRTLSVIFSRTLLIRYVRLYVTFGLWHEPTVCRPSTRQCDVIAP